MKEMFDVEKSTCIVNDGNAAISNCGKIYIISA